MPPPRAKERATTRARAVPKPRVYLTAVVKLTRVRAHGADPTSRTLHFTFPQKSSRSSRATSEFVEVEDVPSFDGESAWFEMEKVQRGEGRRWPWWRAVRQVEPPADA
ncbi:hypothetical protein [Caulobacter endophyticus]|uniref:Uncharacterized protein n=1 Tax=Caulobacter endophyticus TaxID=2172652 RepID=A0A2T9K3Y0_9CAUL|nr:hypothetical protein [Caulobacter endophyticus]PVM90644.1 hypothetical protein DDF67_09440 [Caulobacter endophyticus]